MVREKCTSSVTRVAATFVVAMLDFVGNTNDL
jgi:hypothetical protein